MRRRLVFHAHSAHSAQLNLIFSSAFALSTYLFCLLSSTPSFSLTRSLANTAYHSPSSLCAVNCLHTIALLPVSSCRTQLLLLALLLLCLLLLYCLPHLQVICWPAPATTPASGLNFWRGLFVRQD